MRRTFLILGLVLPLSFWSGCSNPGDEPATLLQSDQLTFVVPAASKAEGTDLGGNFSLPLQPSRSTSIQLPGFRLRAPRGCVGQPVTIAGDWCGDDRQHPAIGYDFGPEGQEFALPLQLEFKLRQEDLAGLDPTTLLVVLDHEDGSFEVIPSQVEEASADDPEIPNGIKISTLVEHFSKYLVATGPPPDEHHDN